MRFLFRSLMGLFLLAVTLALLAVGGATLKSAIDTKNAMEAAPRTARERVFTANVALLQPGTVTPEMTVFGEVRSRRRLELRAAAAGPIVALAPDFADGTHVEVGELLMRVDPADAQSALDLEKTGMREAEAEQREAARAVGLAQDDLAAAEVQAALRAQALDRQKGLADRGLGTASEREAAELAVSNATQSVLSRRQALAQAEARAENAETSLDRRRVTLAEAERRLAETELRAGFSGVLSGVSAVAGGLVAKNEKLGELIDPTSLEVSFRVSTAQYARLIDDAGRLLPLKVTASLDVFGAELVAEGQLSRVDAAVGEGLSGRLVFATLDTPRGFRPGDFVTVGITEAPLDGVAVLPAVAFGSDNSVLALGAEDRLERLAADVLRRQGDDVIIRVGALAGREVVVERSPLLGAGIKVRPVRPEAEMEEANAADDGLVDLTPERRAALVAFVENNGFMPAEAKARVLAKLREDRVPAEVVQRIEARMGG
ncbi:MAG: HlyD family efflux transporter periplasmic adaptor subunit [Rhodobacteraceae bacterium]|nr:HlyD family efflux transporter periplasmic adaptor subunit [Paracoccaceae bacterium]